VPRCECGLVSSGILQSIDWWFVTNYQSTLRNIPEKHISHLISIFISFLNNYVPYTPFNFNVPLYELPITCVQKMRIQCCWTWFFSVSKPECSKSRVSGTAHAHITGLRRILCAERHVGRQWKWWLKMSDLYENLKDLHLYRLLLCVQTDGLAGRENPFNGNFAGIRRRLKA
jgi:hypothetical protein